MVKVQTIAILGATGSIGRQVKAVLGNEYQIKLVSANVNGLSLAKEYYSSSIPLTIVSNQEYKIEPNDKNNHVFSTACLSDPKTYEGIDVVVNGISGIEGVCPSFAALEAGSKLITANKETFVSAGGLFMQRAKELGAKVGEKIIPIDSEHSAIWQCLRGEDFSSISTITLTASGGAFRDLSKEEISTKTADFALAHPTWKMGKKVTIDSATLMNKGFEIIEAKHLFATNNVEVVIHRESLIHSVVTFNDGSSKLHFSAPDMRIPINYALTEPNRKDVENAVKTPSIYALQNLNFAPPDYDRFPCLKICSEVAKSGSDYLGCIACAADEVAVELYLKGQLSFYGISDIISSALSNFTSGEITSPEDVMRIYQQVRQYILSIIGGC